MDLSNISRCLPWLPILSIPRLPDTPHPPGMIELVDRLLPDDSWTCAVSFLAACLATAQLAITIFSGTAALAFVNTMIVLGCWLGYKYIHDETYTKRLETTAELAQQQLQEQIKLTKQDAEQLALERESVTNLKGEVTKLQNSLTQKETLVTSLQDQLAQLALQATARKSLASTRSDQYEQLESQLATLQRLVPTLELPNPEPQPQTTPQKQALIGQEEAPNTKQETDLTDLLSAMNALREAQGPLIKA